jgi:membrane-associated phospholipid phosphatase
MPRRSRLALFCAGIGVTLLIVTWYAAFHIGIVERADQSILRGFAGLHRLRVDRVTSFIADLCDPQPYVYFAAGVVLVALLRGRPRVAATVGLIMLAANVTTQLLKPLLAHARADSLLGHPTVAAASWPSGHATAAMSLALCCVIVAPARRRPYVAALGAAFAVAVSYSFLELEWHYPSDVFGGFLVAATWTLLGVAAVFYLDGRLSRRAWLTGVPASVASAAGGGTDPRRIPIRDALGPPAAALLGAIVLSGLIVLARPHEVYVYAHAHQAFVVGAAAIAALGLALATGLMLALRR